MVALIIVVMIRLECIESVHVPWEEYRVSAWSCTEVHDIIVQITGILVCLKRDKGLNKKGPEESYTPSDLPLSLVI